MIIIYYWMERLIIASGLFSSLSQSWPTTILTVSHDRTFLAVVCTDIIHMHNERLDGYRGDYEVSLFVMGFSKRLSPFYRVNRATTLC